MGCAPEVSEWLGARSDVKDVITIPGQGLILISSPAGESFSEEEAHQMCLECKGKLLSYGKLDVWDELKRAHADEPSAHKIVKKK